MEKYKQLFLDILIIFGTPVIIILAARLVPGFPGSSDALLSSDSSSLMSSLGDAGKLGVKSEDVLNQLNSIKLDPKFFSDPAFVSLKDYTPTYATTSKDSKGRAYPFSSPVEIESMRLKSRTSNTEAKKVLP